MRGPLDVAQHLLAADVPHEIVRLPRRADSARELPDVLGVPARSCVVVEVFEVDTGPVVTLALADAVIGTATLAKMTGSRSVRRPDVAAVSRATDFMATLVAPVGLPETLPVLADARLVTPDVLFAPTGDSGTALKIRGRDLVRAAGAGVGDLAVAAPVAAGRPGVRESGRQPVALHRR